MRQIAKLLLQVPAIAVVGWLTATSAQAAFIGADPLGSFGNLVAPGVDFLNTDVFEINGPSANAGSDDFSPVLNGSPLTPDPLVIDLNNLTGLVLSNADWGSFTAASSLLLDRTANFVQVGLLGTFDNSSAAGGAFIYNNFTAAGGEAASLRYSMTLTGDAISWSGTLNLPPVTVPEPSTMALGALGLIGLGAVSLRRRKRAA